MNAFLVWISVIPIRFHLRKRILRIFLYGAFDFKHGDCFNGTYRIEPTSVQIFMSCMNEGKLRAGELRKSVLEKITSKVVRAIQENSEVGTCIRLPASDFVPDSMKPAIINLDTGESSIIVNITKIVRET